MVGRYQMRGVTARAQSGRKHNQLIGWTALLFLGVGFSESVSTVISSIGNVGPGLGTCGPAYSWNSLPDLAKWILSFLMLVGRLELFSVLLLFYPGFWKNR